MAVVPTSENEARGESLDVPLPRCRQCLVEIVDVHDHAALGRAERAEVCQVTVAACLNAHAGRRSRREVRGHVERCATVERERRFQHAAVAHRDQLGDTPLARLPEKVDGIVPTGRRAPVCVRLPRAGIAQTLSVSTELLAKRTWLDGVPFRQTRPLSGAPPCHRHACSNGRAPRGHAGCPLAAVVSGLARFCGGAE